MTAPTVKDGIRILIETVDEEVLGRGSKVSRLLGEVMAMAGGSWLGVSGFKNTCFTFNNLFVEMRKS